MPRDLGLANRLRAAGLTVRETNGWKTRGDDSFFPKGAVMHHTAGLPQAPGRRAPSLATVINGRSDLSGPLCNVFQDYDDVVYVIAAGRANHAGLPDGGSCRGMTGNSSAWGLEVEHTGKFRASDQRIAVSARILAACIKGRADAHQVVQHREWAPSRKPDFATNFGPLGGPTDIAACDAFRHKVAVALAGPKKVVFQLVDEGHVADRSLEADEGFAPELARLQAFLGKNDGDMVKRLRAEGAQGSVTIVRKVV